MRRATRSALILAGAGGPLGAVVLEQLLALGHWPEVQVLVHRPVAVALTGLALRRAPDEPGAPAQPEPADAAAGPWARAPLPADTAVLVLDREGSRHGREAAFLRPRPETLPWIAGWLQAQGVRHLICVLPHAPGLLPQALRAGLATIDEQSVATLGFDHLVLVRPAHLGTPMRSAVGAGWRSLGPRVAQAVLAQLRWMVPEREQALRPSRVAELVAQLARALPASSPGTRVLAPEGVWDWAQPGGGAAWLQGWLEGRALPPAPAAARRW